MFQVGPRCGLTNTSVSFYNTVQTTLAYATLNMNIWIWNSCAFVQIAMRLSTSKITQGRGLVLALESQVLGLGLGLAVWVLGLGLGLGTQVLVNNTDHNMTTVKRINE